MYEGDSEDDDKLRILPTPEMSDGEIPSPSKNCVTKGLSDLFSFRKKKSHAEAGQELQDVSRGSTSSDPPRRVQNLLEESTTEQSKPEENPEPQQSSSSDPPSSTADSVRNGTIKLEDQGQNQSDPSPSAPIPLPNGSTSSEEHGPNPGEFEGWNPISSMWRAVLSCKIWRYILYGKAEPRSEEEEEALKEHSRSDALCAVLLISILVTAITTVLYFQLKSWPQATRSYYTDDSRDNARDGLIYTCGCSLPPSLQSAENPPETTNLNVCYDPSSLETVTILMYPDFGEGYDIGLKVFDSNIVPFARPVDGFQVLQDAPELTVVDTSAYVSLSSLYSYTDDHSAYSAIYPSIEYLLSPSFNYFSDDYTHMSLFYDCTDCDVCTLEIANFQVQKVVSGFYAECYYYPNLEKCNTTSKNYTAKCVLYPDGTLPTVPGIKSFLQQLLNISGVTNVRGELNEYHNATALHYDNLYMIINEVTPSSFYLNFVEAPKGSPLSETILNSYPDLETSCSSGPLQQTCLPSTGICNSVWVCRLYPVPGSLQQTCLDSSLADVTAYCQLSEGMVSRDELSDETQRTLCNGWKSNTTLTNPELIEWTFDSNKIVGGLVYDALNGFLADPPMDIDMYNLNQNAAVCSKTYTDVIRYEPPGDATTPPQQGDQQDQQQNTMFLEGQCTSSAASTPNTNVNTTVNQPGIFLNTTGTQAPFCWATGNFSHLSDLPNADLTLLPPELYQANPDLFVCYWVGREKFVPWFINAFGILFGWVGTIQLVFYAAFSWLFVPLRKRMSKRSQQLRAGSEIRPSE